MTCFLTSSTCIVGASLFNPVNGFVAELKAALPARMTALFIASDPDNFERTDRFGGDIRDCFEAAGFAFDAYTMLDHRNCGNAAALIARAHLVILAGGHVPTQNRFFHEIGLKELLADYKGVVMGISAGTMNAAETVYAHPELAGETGPDYERFLPGLGLTKIMVLPHYQMIKDDVLDGLRLFEDVAYPDSMGREFFALVDGSYLLIKGGKEELRGEAYCIRDGVLTQISQVGDIIPLN